MQEYKLQYLTYKSDNNFVNENITINGLDEPQSLDEFDVNIIDLSSENIWRSNNYNIDFPHCIGEFKLLKTMIENSNKTNILIILPQNCDFVFNLEVGWEYRRFCAIKHLLGNQFEDWVNKLAYFSPNRLLYENTTTKIHNCNYKAAFHFSEQYLNEDCKITTSEGSEKITTIKYRGMYFTTLELGSAKDILNLLSYIGLIQLHTKMPDWILALEMFNDVEEKQKIAENNSIIEQAEAGIKKAEVQLESNNRYKSILYTNGNELVEVVFEILERMLEYDLSDFKDEKKEDFLIELEDVSFIGEIKGVTSNVKSEHVSQLDVHYQSYLEKLSDEGRDVNVKALLIINHQRKISLSERQEVHKNQITLAERNGSLIVETYTLLRIYEKFLREEMSTLDIRNMFLNEKGLLVLTQS